MISGFFALKYWFICKSMEYWQGHVCYMVHRMGQHPAIVRIVWDEMLEAPEQRSVYLEKAGRAVQDQHGSDGRCAQE